MTSLVMGIGATWRPLRSPLLPLQRTHVSDILVIADPKTLGEMRRHYHGELKKRLVGEIDKTMTGEPTDRIEQAIANA